MQHLMQTGANAGRLLCTYLNGKHLLISDETGQLANTCFTICTGHFRMHQSFQMVWETFKVSNQPCQVCCHHQDGCVTLPAPTPSQTCHVLCSNSLGVPGAVGHFCDLMTTTTGIYSLFFFLYELRNAAQQPWGGGWSLHPGAEAWGDEGIWTSFIWWWWASGSAAMQHMTFVEYPKHHTVPQHSNC